MLIETRNKVHWKYLVCKLNLHKDCNMSEIITTYCQAEPGVNDSSV